MGLIITSIVPGLSLSDGSDMVPLCNCSACAGASASGATTPHVMAQAMAEGATGTRGATMLTQYMDPAGFYSFSGDRNIDAVLIGSKWTGTALTFSFPDSGTVYGNRYDFGQALRHVEFNDAQKAASRDAFAMISGYTNLTFTELAPDSEERPTIRLSSTNLQDVGSAMGYFPNLPDGVAGDIWFGRTQQPYYEDPQRGNWGYITVLHEIGHTMGLKHGHSDYTNDDLGSYFGLDRSFYGTRALEYERDGQQWSIMSYTNAPNTIPAYNGDAKSQAQTYMMYDIAALQYMYGANYATNGGDTVYRWDPNTGALSLNGVVQYTPTGNKVLSTVWDGGGNDTYDFGAYTSGLSIDLRPGEMTTLSLEQRANALAYIDGVSPMSSNIGNALLYQGNTASLIENAIGGSGNDRIVGNQANNRLEGGAGDDMLAGGKGSDLLIGGAGNDVADFADAASGITIAFNNGAADIVVANGGDRDVLRGIEGAVGTAFNDRLTGDNGDNFLSGGSGGYDVLTGGAGNDTLIGAGDTVVQNDRADIVKDIDWYNQTMSTAISLDGAFDLVAAEDVEQSTRLPHATVRGSGAGGAVDYYRFTAEAGARAIFDLDGVAPGFTAIDIVDQFGRVVATNQGVAQSDAGSREGGAPMLNYTFETTGIFYVRVGGVFTDYNSNPPRDMIGGFRGDTDYVLNVSLESAQVDTTILARGSGKFDGGNGNDLIVASSGNDVIAGGNNADTVSYINARARVSVDLSITTAQNTGGSGIDTISSTENLTGSRFADTLKGNMYDNTINGGGGNDRLIGGDGIDTLSFAGQTRTVTFSLAGQDYAQNAALGSIVIASGFENLTGGSGNDRLSGDAAANVIDGGAGDDVLVGSANGVSNGRDTLIGGSGFDIVSFESTQAGLFGALADNGTGSVRTGDGTVLAHFIGIEGLEGGSGDDVLSGNAGNNYMSGGYGNDNLWGGLGDDVLEGGWGDDLLRGSDGNDTAVYGGYGTHFVDLAKTGAQDTNMGFDTLSGIENLKGGFGSDYFFGNALDNRFIDVGGNDIYVGRGGSDTVDYSSATGMLRVDLSIGFQQNTGAAGFDLLDTIENVIGGNAGNVLRGNTGANRLVGGSDADVLIGGLGNDRLEGGAGTDLLVGDLGNIASNPDRLSMNDILIGGAGTDYLIGGEGDDILQGGTGNDLLISGNGLIQETGDRVALAGIINGDGGRDTIDGGEGDDEAILLYTGRTEAIRIDMRDTQATNAITYDGVQYGSITGVETLRFVGGSGDDHVQTAEGYDILQGGDGNDWLSSGEGDDTLIGGEGDDYLDGGAGFDLVSYERASAGVVVDLRRDGAQNTLGAGRDTLVNIENVNTSAFGDLVFGNEGSNTIRDSSGGDDIFYGLGGSDSLGVFRQYPDAKAQTIYLDGGDGSDVVEYYSSPTYNRFVPPSFYRQVDTVTLIGGNGRDGIYMSGQKVGIIDAGEGDDLVTIGMGGQVETTIDISLGKGGADVLHIAYTDNYLGTFDLTKNFVRDFDTGAGGDRVNLTNIRTGWDPGANWFADGHLQLVQSGSDVLFQMDVDGAGTDFGWHTVMTFVGERVDDFTKDNFYRTVGDGFFEPITEEPLDPKGGSAIAVTPEVALPEDGSFGDVFGAQMALAHLNMAYA